MQVNIVPFHSNKEEKKYPVWQQNLQNSTPFFKSSTNIILIIMLGIFLILATSFFLIYPRWQKRPAYLSSGSSFQNASIGPSNFSLQKNRSSFNLPDIPLENL